MIFLKNICGLISRCLATCLETKAHHLAPFVQKESSVLQMGKVSILQGEWGLPHSIDSKLQVKANLAMTHNAGPDAWTKVAGKILDLTGRTLVWVKQATCLLCLIRTWSTAFPLEHGKNMRCGCWNPQSICLWRRKPSLRLRLLTLIFTSSCGNGEIVQKEKWLSWRMQYQSKPDMRP